MGLAQQTPSVDESTAVQDQAPDTAAPATSEFGYKSAGQAYDNIEADIDAIDSMQRSGIGYVAEQLKNIDTPMEVSALKAGLAIGFAAVSAGLGAVTGGLSFVALAGIGAGFAAVGEGLNAAFAGSAPAGLADFKLKCENALTRRTLKMKNETEAKLNLATTTTADWDQAKRDFTSSTLEQLQTKEINATMDGWMNAVNAKTNGSGGALKQGEDQAGIGDATTGRFHMTVDIRHNADGTLRLRRGYDATIDGIGNQDLANRYLERKIGEIGMFLNFKIGTVPNGGSANAMTGGAVWGAYGWVGGSSGQMTEEVNDSFKSIVQGWGGGDYATGRERVRTALNNTTPKALGVGTVGLSNDNPLSDL